MPVRRSFSSKHGDFAQDQKPLSLINLMGGGGIRKHSKLTRDCLEIIGKSQLHALETKVLLSTEQIHESIGRLNEVLVFKKNGKLGFSFSRDAPTVPPLEGSPPRKDLLASGAISTSRYTSVTGLKTQATNILLPSFLHHSFNTPSPSVLLHSGTTRCPLSTLSPLHLSPCSRPWWTSDGSHPSSPLNSTSPTPCTSFFVTISDQ